MKSNLIDLELMVHFFTAKAVKVSADGNEQAAKWLPKSVIEHEEELVIGRAQIITLPRRMAEDKGLV